MSLSRAQNIFMPFNINSIVILIKVDQRFQSKTDLLQVLPPSLNPVPFWMLPLKSESLDNAIQDFLLA